MKKRQYAVCKPQMRAISEDAGADYVCLGLILLCASMLILSNLGNIYMWGDEASTALVSKTILSHGIPMGTDGTNRFSQLSGAECTKDMVWVWHPWLPFYLLSGFYALFGVSTFTARLPFALFGIATIVLVHIFGRSLWQSRRAGIYSAVLLMVSVPFLILVRQCRYYSPEIFLSLLGIYAYHMLLERRRHAPLLLGLSAFLLFHTHYVQCAVLLGTVIIHSLMFNRDRLKPVLIISAAVAAVNIPWIVMFSGIRNVISGYGAPGERLVTAVRVYCTDIAECVLHPALLLIPVFLAVGCLRRNGRLPTIDPDRAHGVYLLGLFVVLTVAGSALTAQYVLFRYIGPVIPPLCLIAGLILSSIHRVHALAGVALVAAMAYWMRMPQYLYEITHDYDGPSEGIVRYLNEHGSAGDVVAVNHEDLPIKFYTRMRVISGVTGEDWSEAESADWIVMHRHGSSVERRYSDCLLGILRRGGYQAIELAYPDIPFENREEPRLHNFRTVKDAPRIVIFRRVSTQ